MFQNKPFLCLFIFLTLNAFTQTPEQIIERLEAVQTPAFMTVKGSMSLKDRFGDRLITFLSRSRGEDRMLLEFTSDSELGQKILRIGRDLYMYYPDAERTITIKGSALGDGIMGSDMSYEDLTGNKSLLESYTPTLIGMETVLERECWVISLKAKSRDVPYDTQTLWVDKEDNVTRQAHQFSRSGRLLRTMKVLQTRRIGNWILGVRIQLEDQLRRGTSTTFTMNEIDLTTPIPPGKFTLNELGR